MFYKETLFDKLMKFPNHKKLEWFQKLLYLFSVKKA